MANILNIDTSAKICSVALAKDGEIMMGFESSEEMDHSRSLAPFVEKCMEYLRNNEMKLDAVSVANGPGSYTGLRIGLSMAKGISFGLDIPLIAVSSLEVMTVRAIFTYPNFNGDEYIVPMVDARRMEVYTATFDSSLNLVEPERALILEKDSFDEIVKKNKVIFIGDGTDKFKEIFEGGDVVFLGSGMPHAKYLAPLSEKYYREKRFSDVAYTVPSYLKEYQATQPKNRL